MLRTLRIAFCAFACVAVTSGYQAGECGHAGPIVDAHMNAFTLERWSSGRLVPNPLTRQPSSATTSAASRDRAIATMKRCGVVRAVLSGAVDDVAVWAAAAPSSFLRGIYFRGLSDGPYRLPNVDTLRTAIETGQVEVIAEVAVEYDHIPPDAPTMEPYYTLAEELDVPLGIHLGHPGRDPDTGSPARLGTVLQQHPGLRLYLIHAGGAFLEAAIELMVAHPTVYADLSALVWREPQEDFYGRLRRLIDAGLEDRIMFGTDQLIWPELIPVAIQSVESAPFLSAEQKHKIFYANAARFFRLE